MGWVTGTDHLFYSVSMILVSLFMIIYHIGHWSWPVILASDLGQWSWPVILATDLGQWSYLKISCRFRVHLSWWYHRHPCQTFGNTLWTLQSGNDTNFWSQKEEMELTECDQMARLFFNICPSSAKKLCQKWVQHVTKYEINLSKHF